MPALTLYYILPLPVVLGVVAWCRRQGWEWMSIGLILLAMALYYANLYHSKWDAFAVDPLAHETYIEWLAHPAPQMASDTQHPASYYSLQSRYTRWYALDANEDRRGDSAATRHPPTYYLPAALFYHVGESGGLENPLLLVRHFSVMIFMGFILLSVSLLRLVLPVKGAGYFSALGLLLFWPIGVMMSGRITCDILLYMTQAGVLLYLARWFRDGNPSSLSAGFLWSGFSMMTKNTGVLMLALAGGVLLAALWKHRRALAALLRYDLLCSIVFALMCRYYTVHQSWLMDYIGAQPLSLAQFLQDLRHVLTSFNLFIYLYDIDVGLGHDMFWDMLLHSLLLGAQWWKSGSIEIAFHVVWFAILVYTLEGMLRFGCLKGTEKGMMMCMGMFIFVMIAGMMYMRVRTGNIEYGDGRYMYAAVAPIAAFFGTALHSNQMRGRRAMRQIGEGLAFSFVLMTFALFAVEYLPLHFD